MLTIETIDSNNRSDVIRFYQIPFPIYANCPAMGAPAVG